MNIITRKTQPKFTRKPLSTKAVKLEDSQQQSQSIVMSKGLRINRNVVNMLVNGCQKQKEDQLMELLFTDEKVFKEEKYQNYEQSIQKSTFSRNIFLDYSPDSVFATPFPQYNNHDQSMLIESQQKTIGKTQISTNSTEGYIAQRTIWMQKQGMRSNISHFNLSQRMKGGSSITVSLISMDSPSFLVSYSYQSQARRIFEEQRNLFKGEGQKILNRLKKLFKKSPLLLFKFYTQVIVQYENIKLRQFLMKNSIKYTTDQIVNLQEDIDKGLDMCKGEEIIQIIFMGNQQQEMVNVNLSHCQVGQKINIFQWNFWKVFSGVVTGVRKNSILQFQVSKIQQFICKLI